MGFRRPLCRFLLAACGTAATLAVTPAFGEGDTPRAEVIDRAQWIADVAASAGVRGAEAEAESARLSQLRGAELAGALRSLVAGGDLPLATRESLIHESVLRIGAGTLQDGAELELLRELAGYKSQVTYMEPACRNAVEQPVFPIAHAASQALDRRVQLDGRAEGERLYLAGDLRALIGQLSEEQGPFAQGMFEAVYTGERAGPIEAAIMGMNPVLVSREPVGNLLLHCCAISRDPVTEERIIRHAPEIHALRVLTWVHTHGEAGAMPLLEAALTRPETASAGVVEMGRFADSNGPARERLLGLLGDEALGASAALALSRRRDPGLVEQLGNRLMAAESRVEQARLALALRLNRSARAGEWLSAYAQRPDADAGIRAEVAGR